MPKKTKKIDYVSEPGVLFSEKRLPLLWKNGRIGLSVAEDGRVWICFNGESILRFKPNLKAEKGE